ncbi:hypothetical protein EAE96_010515 [Botrytis aclada]|nr:hypothetical protein EAE96_010515 [Botrytis aclada]
MVSQILTAYLTAFLILTSIFLMRRFLFSKRSDNPIFPEITRISKTLAAALPDSVILPQSVTTFNKVVDGYWAKQECEVNPACVVRPRNDEELCTAVTIIKRKYDERRKQQVGGEHISGGLFAIRSGGHSCVAGAASIEGGVLIDLSCFNEVIPSQENDESSVIIGAGCRWMDVSKVLDERGLAVVGGRNSAVGVGGLTLGGGLSFFCPQFGLVCSNMISYDIVLASGTLTTASATRILISGVPSKEVQIISVSLLASRPAVFPVPKSGADFFTCLVLKLAKSFLPSMRL